MYVLPMQLIIYSYPSIHIEIEIGIYLHIHLLNIISCIGCATTFITEKSIIDPKILNFFKMSNIVIGY